VRIIDVTLRDGGHAVNFNWDVSYAKEHYETLSKIPEVKFIELGYWKQTSKTKNPFYNLNYDFVEKITGKKKLRNVSIMIDYHYCSKNINDYPINKQKEIGMIRMCSRKEDIKKALEFGEKLKKHTKINVSFNVFNVANYSKQELMNTCKQIAKYKMDYVYFADTHGGMDLSRLFKKFDKAIKCLKKSGKEIGMHLHDHSGRGYFNFRQLKKYKIFMSDASVRGIGKGFGNLRLEHIVNSKYISILAKLINNHNTLLVMPPNPYTLITSKYNITDNYAAQGKQLSVPMNKFEKFCSRVKGIDRDTFNKKLILKA
jgi:4-hydroxy 2-oxovalerate aldolase|tara:strand:- start:911 stop:1852 length:942 start_codon:yes stop_codon:yes gene_type:complete